MLKDDTAYAAALGTLLQEYRGNDVIVLDLREAGAWTDFFVIATVTSAVHLQGLERRVREFSAENRLDILRVSPRPKGAAEEEWLIIDLGTIVVHLMTRNARDFYELERLWDTAAVVFQTAASPVSASPLRQSGEASAYSSSSSSG